MSTSPELKLLWWNIKDLIPYELNAKKHEKEQVKRIAKAISLHGFDQPIVVDKNGVIIKGHGRRLAVLELGTGYRHWPMVPVVQHKHLNPDEVKAMRLADNRVAVGDLDSELLRADLATMDAEALKGIFDDKELLFGTADLGEMNAGVFVDDMDGVLAEQKAELEEKVAATAGGRVTLAKAFGFKDIPAAAQIAITALMAKAEALTGLKNQEALVAFAHQLG